MISCLILKFKNEWSIFFCQQWNIFRGILMISVGDFFQLPPVGWIANDWQNGLWSGLSVWLSSYICRKCKCKQTQSSKSAIYFRWFVYSNSNDHLPKNVLNHELNEVPSGNQKETDGLAQILEVQVAARVMLTVDIDLQKRLVNGELGTVKHISWGSTKNTIKIYVNFDGDKDWIKRMNTGNFTEQHFWVPK